MKKLLFSSSIILLAALLAVSCKKDKEQPGAGKGGNATLKVTPIHHAEFIDSCVVYIKYNASDAPASYDDSTVCVQEAGKPVATFTQLRKGKYYLMGKGWDPNDLTAVKGAIPYEIKQDTVIAIVLPVSESH